MSFYTLLYIGIGYLITDKKIDLLFNVYVFKIADQEVRSQGRDFTAWIMEIWRCFIPLPRNTCYAGALGYHKHL